MAEKKRLVWIDLLRVFSVFGVILIHITSLHKINLASNFDADQFMTFHAPGWFSLFCVPVFLMISGYLAFQKPKQTTGEVWRKIRHFFFVYLFWNVIYALVIAWSRDKLTGDWIFGEGLQFLFPGLFHMWYLPVFMVLLAFLPIFHKTLRNDRKLFRYTVILLFFLGPVVYSVKEYLLLQTPSPLANSILEFIRYTRIPIPLTYLFFYLLGGYFRHIKGSFLLSSLFFAGATVLYGGLLFYLREVSTGNPELSIMSQCINDNAALPLALYSISIFAVFHSLEGYFQKSKFWEWLSKPGKYSFGIYLMHMIFIQIAREKYSFFAPQKFGAYVLYSLCIYVACLIITRILFLTKKTSLLVR